MRHALTFLNPAFVFRISADLVASLVVCCVLFSDASSSFAADSLTWSQLPSLPSREGFAGPFAGTHHGVLLVAGGANFPGKMPWEGGTKVWYDRVFVLESPDGVWQDVGELPRALGYGVSISTEDGVVCIGGSDASRHYADCFRLKWQDGKVITTALPPLPKPCANCCGAMMDGTVYVAGGLESPTATSTLKTFWSLNLANSNAKWQEHDPWPGPPRMLATAAVQDNAFFLCSGTDLELGSDGRPIREYLRDAYSFHPDRGWKRIADMPRAAVASPSPAPGFGPLRFLVLSGDDGTQVDFQPLEKHPGFPKSVLAYHSVTDTWQDVGEVPVGQVTTVMVDWRDRFVVPSGEIRPGVRTSSVWSLLKSK